MFTESNQRLTFVTTDCETGDPYYVENIDNPTSFKALEASTSLPFAAKMVDLHGKQLLDGGISDPIPIEKALDDGCKKLVVILTQPQGYQKSPFKAKFLAHLKYKRYPKLVELLLTRHHIYNRQLELLEQLEQQGRAFIIRPACKLPISRTEKNKEKLKKTFNYGLEQGNQISDALFRFIGE